MAIALDREFASAGNARVGRGFITWSLAKQPELLVRALAHAPVLLMLAFGDPALLALAIRATGSRLIARPHLIAGPRSLSAGRHGATWATLTLVPEVADLLAREAPATLLVAAGGIADGRGLAASLMLGAATVQSARPPPTSPGVTTGRENSPDGYCARRSSCAGMVAKRSTARWRRPHVRRIWGPWPKAARRKAVCSWRGDRPERDVSPVAEISRG